MYDNKRASMKYIYISTSIYSVYNAPIGYMCGYEVVSKYQ